MKWCMRMTPEKVRRCVLLFVAAGVTSHGHGEAWRFPDSSDLTGAWARSSESEAPYRAAGDFDGNGLPDEAWISLSVPETQWRLVILMNDGAEALTLFTSTSGDARRYGIGRVPPGDHRTACGKGYWDCEEGEPALLSIVNPGIRLFRFESASRIFYWDTETGRFSQVWESD